MSYGLVFTTTTKMFSLNKKLLYRDSSGSIIGWGPALQLYTLLDYSPLINIQQVTVHIIFVEQGTAISGIGFVQVVVLYSTKEYLCKISAFLVHRNHFSQSFLSIDIRRLEYSEIIPRISSLYWHPITLKKGAKMAKNRFMVSFQG